ncbi:MAG TPA: hypothetical protein VHA82_12385 [Ramlibacter sp.]|uniref:hypothetical protein n=1 Tax=Ramlibacter sp. TaxID=1917967 RepID=UPI002BD7FED0|nr:hypothetical protein [Ramlibacter sp.]HVZ44599.1 hypothetical protein [Ramlibacter sp.]
MTRAEFIAVIALLVSALAFGLSFYVAFRDRAKIVARSKFWPASEYGPAGMRISITNAGRRPIVLRMIVTVGEAGNWSGTYLGDYKTGLRLGEHELHEETWGKSDLVIGPEHDEIAVDAQVEDSLGRRYPVKDAKKNMLTLLGS